MPTEGRSTRFVGVDFSDLPWNAAVARIVAAAVEPRFTTIVTPNVDHIVRMERLGDAPLGQAYRAALADADFCFCDSRILARLARFLGITLQLVPGSDLTAELFNQQLKPGDTIAVVGGDETTIAALTQRYPQIAVTQHIPPMGMINDPVAIDAAADFIRNTTARFTFIAVGSPQGEIVAKRARERGASRGVALSIGASIDFLTGRQTRAPRMMQKLGLEWLHRLLANPKRLWRRYLIDGPLIFAIVMRNSDR